MPLFLVAATLRIIYLLIAANHLGMSKFWNICPDTGTYWIVANEFLGGDPMGQYALFRVGPGYGAILAVIRTLFGSDPLPSLLFSVVMGALAPVAIYLLAWSIFRNRFLAVVAGGISAFSLTSISLSCHILTDQPYFTLQCFSLYLLVEAIRRRQTSWFVWAGLLTGVAALVRPSGQLWPVLFLVIPALLPLPSAYTSRRQLIGRALLAGAAAIVLTTAWSARNYAVNDVFTFGSNGILTLRNVMVAQVMTDGEPKQIYELRDQFALEDGDYGPDFRVAYDRASDRVKKAFAADPGKFVHWYLVNLWQNIIAPNFLAHNELAPLGPLNDILLERTYLISIFLALLSVSAIGLLAIERRFSAFLVIGLTYGYFTVLMGLTSWQGSRLHYPAEMAWVILLPYMAMTLVARLARILRTRYPNSGVGLQLDRLGACISDSAGARW